MLMYFIYLEYYNTSFFISGLMFVSVKENET